ncbi:hypothetical protein [Pseudarthrobacter raffinosi]|uniref:hypothetical protein n=1 Tax=Pseudarthrobacter raffinosi TaxID=2953651 RepID=UPI00208EF13C|nr:MULTISPECIES: hypothetical protein [unclassified Pseudarthrobacter]MCO4236293.1 hypothetical protein [Pseudarthrobacter sp. MDT3-28]MCO4250389.1 hypothetical protein [Pseudarthrobacter sp. MDT3-9]
MKLEVTASRDGRFWYVESTQIDGLTTQARTVAEIPEMVRDLAAMITGRPESDFDVEVTFDTPEVAAHLRQARELAARSDELKAASAKERHEAAMVLKRQGVTVRDIGAVLGVSHQRAQQLVTH